MHVGEEFGVGSRNEKAEMVLSLPRTAALNPGWTQDQLGVLLRTRSEDGLRASVPWLLGVAV